MNVSTATLDNPLGEAADRLAMYFGYGTGHVLCNAHILRSLNELVSNRRRQAWAQAFTELICDTCDSC